MPPQEGFKPRVFIGSSVEGVDAANAIAHHLQHDARVVTWSGAFDLSSTTIEELEGNFRRADFGVVVLSPDGQTESRGQQELTARDNALFELGMLIGQLGRRRTFAVVPSDLPLHLPTDLLGVTPARYDVAWAEEEAREALSVAGGEIRAAMKHLGPRATKADARAADGASVVDHSSESASGTNARAPVNHDSTDTDTSVPPEAMDAQGIANGWRFFAAMGWLAPVTDSDLREGLPVVHPRHGLGEVVGYGPPGDSDRSAAVRFASGPSLIPLAAKVLFRAERSN